jgi:hypothetical protein
MASTDRDFDDSYYDSYFSKTYVPLSSLPTPPLLSHSNGSIRQNSPDLELDESLDPSLLGTFHSPPYAPRPLSPS